MPDDKKKQRKRNAALGLLLFLPLVRLRGTVSEAADGIEESFDAMFDAFEAEESVAGAVAKGGDGLLDALTTLILNGMQRGYRDASKFSTADKTPDFEKIASVQAKKTTNQMLGTTKGWMKDRGSDGFTLSRDRADRAARYTGAEAYFNGVAFAFQGTGDEFEKAWETTSDEPCMDICQDNEDEGFIPMEDEFQSGHYAPLGHQNCMCFLKVRRAQG